MIDVSPLNMLNMSYNPLTPVTKEFRFKSGFDESTFKSKAKPMVGYKIQ